MHNSITLCTSTHNSATLSTTKEFTNSPHIFTKQKHFTKLYTTHAKKSAILYTPLSSLTQLYKALYNKYKVCLRFSKTFINKSIFRKLLKTLQDFFTTLYTSFTIPHTTLQHNILHNKQNATFANHTELYTTLQNYTNSAQL